MEGTIIGMGAVYLAEAHARRPARGIKVLLPELSVRRGIVSRSFKKRRR